MSNKQEAGKGSKKYVMACDISMAKLVLLKIKLSDLNSISNRKTVLYFVLQKVLFKN